MLLISFVPHAEIEHGSGEEPRFCHAEKKADDKESGETLSEAHEGANDRPDEGDSRKPESWRCESEDDVTWDFEQDVTDKVDGQCCEVLIPGLRFELR